MWVTDELTSEEAERVRVVAETTLRISNARRGSGENGGARGWLWRVEPGMGEAFEDLQSWLLPSQREATVETAALARGAAQLEEGVRSGAHDQSPVPVGWPVPACCPPSRARPTRDADLPVAGFGVACCGIACCAA